MSIIRSMRTRLIRRALNPTAAAFEALGNELAANLPAHTIFTRDDVVELLHDVAQRIRTGDLP